MSTSTEATTSTSAGLKTWNIDPSHSGVTFKVRHLMITNVRGEFQKFSGAVKYDPSNLAASSAEATIEVGSINTKEQGRDDHLKSADFFDAAKYPNITFKSRAIRQGKEGLEIVGDLTIRDQAREVVLQVEGPTPEQKDPWGNTRIGASAETKIKRSEFGITWNTVLEAGGVAVSDDIHIHLDLSLVLAK
ncbi:YceI family protein [Labilithrix luteola]|nr:YceI family protein [Labilithrix luteola]